MRRGPSLSPLRHGATCAGRTAPESAYATGAAGVDLEDDATIEDEFREVGSER
jgi:hypothetical protein